MRRILVIDDEPSTRVLFKSRLEDLDYQVTLAANGAEGLMAARSQEFDLFLVDIGLGSGVDGFEVCKRLKAVPQTNSVPVVLISGQSTTREDLHRGYNAGCESFLMKGNMTLLEDVMRAMLRIKSLKDDIAVQNYMLERQNKRLQVEMEKRGPVEGHANEESRGPESPVGLLLVGHDGLVHFADRGARDLFGPGVEGQPLGVLAPSRGLEAFVRDARIEERSGFRLDLSARAGRLSRSLLVSVVPTMPRGDSNIGGLKTVMFYDLSEDSKNVSVVSPNREHDVSILEAARRLYRMTRIAGSSLGTIDRRERLERACRTSAPVLICGGQGSGKTFTSRVLHFSSDLAGPFLSFDAQAVAPESVHADLFGIGDNGLVQNADQGTLMITNAEALDKKCQQDLVALLESGVLPGGQRSKVRMRIVLTTRMSVAEVDRARPFISDLRTLLNLHTVEIAPLAKRLEDIEPLATEVAWEVSGGAVVLSRGDMQALESYDWPGNVRELEDSIEIIVASTLGDKSALGGLPECLREAGAMAGEQPGELQPVARLNTPRSSDASDEPVSLDGYERLALERALQESQGDKLAAARLLNVGKSTLYRKLKRHGIS